MAVSKVKKLELVAHAQCRDELLSALRALGSVHISDVRELFPDSETESPFFLNAALSEVQAKLDRIRECSAFIGRFISKPSIFESLVRGKHVFTPKELSDCLASINIDRLHEECATHEVELAQNQAAIEKKETIIEDVSHWSRLNCLIELIQDTKTTRASLGVCEARAFGLLVDELDEATPLYNIEIVERSRTSVFMVLVYPVSAEETVEPILRKKGWRQVRFPGLKGTPADIASDLRAEIEDIRDRNRHVRNHVVNDLVPLRDKLLLLDDHYSQEWHALEVQQRFLFTSRTFLLTGWIPASCEDEMKRALRNVGDITDIRFIDPGPDDRIPILLDNKKITQPFTLITELYGRPQYSEFDPTPLFAPFFVLFFAVCLGDAGYGVLLAVGSFIGLKKFKIQGGARKLLQILFIGGLANIVVGLFTGAIFGIASDKLPAALQSLIVFNPTKQVLLFLYIAFGMGVVQVLFGIGVKMVHNYRQGNRVAAFLDQGLWILFLIALVPLVYVNIFGGKVNAEIMSIASKAALVIAVALVLTQGRDSKYLLLRPLLGLLKLYDTMGYFSDVLSYARLMALGLATAFLAIVFNDMARLSLDIPYGIGYVVAFLILVFSHLFNLTINCLGAFVHSLRLQYLEFFSKFFVGGGEPFVPFAEKREFTVVQPVGVDGVAK